MKKKIHVVSYTHWDREFRFDFETTRMWLVELMDHLLEILRERPDYKHYMLDGQFVLVDDYLEIRPEREEEIRELVRQGRLQVGPWYTLPDSSSVNGESLIRNLIFGLQRAEEFGGAMRVGYNVFSFGQISQLPQLYAGFGIDTIVFYKHMDRRRSRFDEFIWQGPDGTAALASRLGREARWNFFFAGHIPIVYDKDPWDKQWRYEWGQMGKLFHLCEPDNYAGFHFIVDPETSFHAENVRDGLHRTLETLKETAVPEHLLFFDGTDFTEPHPLIPDIIAEAQEALGEEYEIVHSTLVDYLEAIQPLLKERDIDTVTGHMKDGPVGSIHTDVVSVHPELKRANSKAENLLYGQAEPFATLAWLQGEIYPETYIEKALRYLFYSQAHDSLHGVGPKTLSDGVLANLQQAQILSGNVAEQAMRQITAQINTDGMEGDLFAVVFNPSPHPRSDVVEMYLDVPQEWPVENLILEDSQGNRAEIVQLERAEARAGLYHPRSRNMPIYIHRFRVLVRVENVPGLGYKTYAVKYAERKQYPYPHEDFDAVKAFHSPLARGPREAENEFVRLVIDLDGTLSVTNKRTGRRFENLNYFRDEGQKGNQQRCYPPEVDEILTTIGQPARIALHINTPLLAEFTVETSLSVPRYFDRKANRRSEERVVLPITSRIRLRKDDPVIEFETTVDNRAKDHFLRVCFDTGLQSDNTYSSEVFTTEHHPTVPTEDGMWQGPPLRRHQQHTFMDISDEQGGLSILCDSVRDYEVLDPAGGVIAQSLVRGVELRIPCDNRLWMEYPGDDSTQSLGMHTTRYGLYLHPANWESAQVLRMASEFSRPLRITQTASHAGRLPVEKGFLEWEDSNLVLSAFKKALQRNSLILRVYNPTSSAIEGEVRFGFDLKSVWQVRLDETRLGEVQFKGNQVSVNVSAGKIVNLEVEGGDICEA